MRFVLIPGAACSSWHWHLVTDELRGRGHEVIAVPGAHFPMLGHPGTLVEYLLS